MSKKWQTGKVLLMKIFFVLLAALSLHQFASVSHSSSTDTVVLSIRPLDIWAPLKVTNLGASSGVTEGTLSLQWTAPHEDTLPIPTGDAVKGYIVRYATFSIQSLGGDTTAWFNQASFNFDLWPGQSPGSTENPTIGGLEPGATLFFIVRSSDEVNNESVLTESATAQVKDNIPTAPTNLTTLSVTESTITITWTAPSPYPSDLDFYRVYMNTATPAVWNATVSVSVPITSYTFSNLIPQVTYQFRVTVKDKGMPNYLGSAFESLDSNTITTNLKVNPPSSFIVASVSTNSITWQWTDNSIVEDSYRVYSTTGGEVGSVSAVAGSGSSVQWTESNLTPGASYQRYVVAVDQGINSDPSSTVIKFTLPNAPENIVRSTATSSTVGLTWSANNNASYIRYILERAPYPPGAYVDIATVTTISYTDTLSLAEFTTYSYRLKAMNGEDVESSSIVLATATILVKPGHVTALSAVAGTTEGEAILRWIAPGDDNTVGNISGGEFDIRWSTNNITSEIDFNNISATYQRLVTTNTVVSTDQTYRITGIQFGGLVYFAMKVRDEIAGNYSPLSVVVSTMLKVNTVMGFTAVSATTQTITWQWTDNSAVEDLFRVYTTTGGLMGSTNAASGTGSAVQWTETGLTPGASYQRYVVSVDQGVQSDPSSSYMKFTLVNPPVSIVRSTASPSSITLAWSANNNASGTKYVIERSSYPTISYVQIATVTATTYTDNLALAEFTTYSYQLKARNGENLDSGTVVFDTSTIFVKPGRISNLNAQPGGTESTVVLSWTVPGDDLTIGNIAGGEYDIRWSQGVIASDSDFNNIVNPSYKKVISTNAVLGAQESIQMNLDGFEPGTTFYFAMKVRDEIAGNYSDMSNVVVSIIQVDNVIPGTVNDLAASLSTTSVIAAKLTWTAPGDDGFVKKNAFGAYDVRYRTDQPITNLTLFNQAASVTTFTAIAGSSIPSPADSNVGAQEKLLLSGLAYDTTYYFAMRTRDEMFINFSALSNTATVTTPDIKAPGIVQNFVAFANGAAGKQIDLSWTNPLDIDLKGIRILVSTASIVTSPLSESKDITRYDLTGSTSSNSIPTTFVHKKLVIGLTYYYSVFTFDDELTPNFSIGVTASTVPLKTKLTPPGRATNVKGTRSQDGEVFTIQWDAPTTRANGEPFESKELASYNIYRMAALNGATNQTFVQSASSPTFYVDDTLFKRTLFYKVRAVNVASMESEDSDSVSADGDVLVMMEDGVSFIKIDADMMDDLVRRNIKIDTRRDKSQEGGKVFKSMSIEAKDKTTGEPKKGFLFNRHIQIALGYHVDASGNVSNGAPALAFAQPMPKAADAEKAFSVYWFNGNQWLKLGTTFDPASKTASVRSKHAGGYQLRLVQQALSPQLNAAYPQTITPNGDGINDICFFMFENPTDAPVKATIYDMRSAKVADAKKVTIFEGNNIVLSWDGRDESGGIVTGGAYMYKIVIGDKTFTGTVAVAR